MSTATTSSSNTAEGRRKPKNLRRDPRIVISVQDRNDPLLSFESSCGCVNGNYAIFLEAAVGGAAVQATDCGLDANHAV
jgi:hypothetical protein